MNTDTDTPELNHVESPAPPTAEPHPAAIYTDQERSLARGFQSAVLDQSHFVSFGDALRSLAYLADELAGENALAGRDSDAQLWATRATLIVGCARQLDELSNPLAKPQVNPISAQDAYTATQRDVLMRCLEQAVYALHPGHNMNTRMRLSVVDSITDQLAQHRIGVDYLRNGLPVITLPPESTILA